VVEKFLATKFSLLKENDMSRENNMSDEMLFISNGKVLKQADAVKYPILACGLTETNITHVFEDNQTFEKWAATTSSAAKINSIFAKIAEAKKYKKTDISYLKNRKEKIIERVNQDMTDLAERTGLDPASEELFLKATLDSDDLEGAIFDPITAFDSVGRGGFEIGAPGAWIHLPGGGYPVLGWGGWDNRISSVRISGLALFCQNNWWGGATLWLAGFPVWYYSNLGIWGWDNVASSVWVA
jgi:hypothetical protein